MSTPWTQSISLAWRPQLRFYERRIAVLRELDDRNILRAFRVGEHTIDARLFDDSNSHQLSVRQDGLTLHLLSPDADIDHAWAAVGVAVAEIQPGEARSLTVAFQHLVPLPLDFEEAIKRSRGSIIGTWGAGPASAVTDFALLLDFDTGDPRRHAQTEIGILRDNEIPERLSRGIGRTAGRSNPPVLPRFDPQVFAPVSLFADTAFWQPTLSDADPLDQAWEAWQTTRQEADILVSDLQSRLIPDDNGDDAS